MLGSALALKQVMGDLKATRSELTAKVDERLRRLLICASKNVPYYRDSMVAAGYDPEKDFTGQADLQILPILTKNTIRELGEDAFLNEKADRSLCSVDRSSGSTGYPMSVWRNSRSQALIQAKYFRSLLVNGYRFTDKVLGFRSQNKRVIEMGGRLRHLGLLRWRKVDFQLSTTEMVDHLLAYNPHVLYGNLVHLDLMAEELDRRKLRAGRIKLLVPGGEVVNDSSRQHLEDAFGARVAVTYGSVETGVMAFEVPGKPGLQLCEDLVHYEFLDAKGAQANPGQRCRPIVTDLTNDVMPFIRYDHGDWVSVLPGAPHDVDAWRSLASIEGRENDRFVLSDGSRVTFAVPSATMKNYPQIRQFRLVQKEQDLIEVQVSGERKYLDSIAVDVVSELQKVSPANAHYVFVPMDRILPDKNGKLRILVSELEGRSK